MRPLGCDGSDQETTRDLGSRVTLGWGTPSGAGEEKGHRIMTGKNSVSVTLLLLLIEGCQ